MGVRAVARDEPKDQKQKPRGKTALEGNDTRASWKGAGVVEGSYARRAIPWLQGQRDCVPWLENLAAVSFFKPFAFPG